MTRPRDISRYIFGSRSFSVHVREIVLNVYTVEYRYDKRIYIFYTKTGHNILTLTALYLTTESGHTLQALLYRLDV